MTNSLPEAINKSRFLQLLLLGAFLLGVALPSVAQVTATARMDATRIMVGDQARLFLEVRKPDAAEKVIWPAIPDTFNNLEIVEKGKIDTATVAGATLYKQRLLITGFDSGLFKVPPFVFPVLPASGEQYTATTDSFGLLVQTVEVDTTKAFKPIKGVIAVPSSWRDYIVQIAIGVVAVLLIAGIIIYFIKRKKAAPKPPPVPDETPHQKASRLLTELEEKQLWQKGKVKEYYIELTDVVRNYLEERFNTPVMELTTDEMLQKMQVNKALQPYRDQMTTILYTADLAKFAKAQPTPAEHTDAMEKAKEVIEKSKPVIVETPTGDQK